MQLVIFALLGCCVVVHSASLSADPLTSHESLESLEDKSSSIEDVRRLKRSGGSGGFFAGIGSAILGKVAEASSGASSGSSDSSSRGHQYESVEYGPPVHTYDEKNFDIWSFKKAILNTLFQALKAIGGGVIALKGKLIKGGGIVISTKGSIISAKGEAISTLGRHIAASAVLTPPKTDHGYVYDSPPSHVPSTGHDSYGGPPPSPYGHAGGYSTGGTSDSYGHTAYASPSDDAAHPGLLIIKPVPETIHQHSYQNYGDASIGVDGHGDIGSQSNPGLSVLAESFGGYQKDSGLGDLVNKITVSSFPKTVEHKEENPGLGSNVHHETHVVYNDNYGAKESIDNNQNLNFENVPYSVSQIKNHGNYGTFGNADFSYLKSVEIPILQIQNEPLHFNPHQNYIQDLRVPHASKRNSRSEFPLLQDGSTKIIPRQGFPLTDPRLYRI